jgi:hypothetical protein
LNDKEIQMNKKEKVDALIANEKSGWTEAERDFLMGLSDERLDMFMPIANEEQNTDGAAAAPAAGDGEAAKASVDEAAGQTAADKAAAAPAGEASPATNKAQSMDEFINNAPAEYRDVLKSSLATHNALKDKLIVDIMANKKNTFTKEHLAMKDMTELQALAKLAAPDPAVEPVRPPLYLGQGETSEAVTNAVKEGSKGLGLPTINFAEKTQKAG